MTTFVPLSKYIVPPFDAEKAVEIYTAVLRMSKANGAGKSAAKHAAKEAVYKVYPQMKQAIPTAAGNPYAAFWSEVSHIVNAEFPKDVAAEQANFLPEWEEDRRSFMDVARELAATGFIPKGKYIAPILGVARARQVSAYISFLRKEDNYIIESNDFGWLCTPKPKRKTREEVVAELAAAFLAGEDVTDILKQIRDMSNGN